MVETIKFPDGEYIGHIVNKKKEFSGTMIYSSGDMYRGEWVHDKKEGYGMMFDKNKENEGQNGSHVFCRNYNNSRTGN
jgi:hypothetical protein